MKSCEVFITFFAFLIFQTVISKEILPTSDETSKVITGESGLSPRVESSAGHNKSESLSPFRRTLSRTRLWTPVTTEIPKTSTTTMPTRKMSEADVVHEKWKEFEKNMKKMIEGQMKKALPQFLRMSSNANLSAECSKDIMSLVLGVRGLKSWAFRSKSLFIYL